MHTLAVAAAILSVLASTPEALASATSPPAAAAQPRWTLGFEEPVALAIPAADTDNLFLLTSEHVHCFDTGGQLQWQAALPTEFGEQGDLQALDDGGVLYADITGLLLRYTAGGELEWDYDPAVDLPRIPMRLMAAEPASFVLRDGASGTLFGVDAYGEAGWALSDFGFDVLPYHRLLPEAAGTFLLSVTDFENEEQHLYALDADGDLRWEYDVTPHTALPVADLWPVLRSDGSVVLSGLTSGVASAEYAEEVWFASISADGELEWECTELGSVLGVPANDGTLFIKGDDRTIRAIGRDGEEDWRWDFSAMGTLHLFRLVPGGGELLYFINAEGGPTEHRLVRLGADGTVQAQYWLPAPPEGFGWWWMQVCGDVLLVSGDQYEVQAFAL